MLKLSDITLPANHPAVMDYSAAEMHWKRWSRIADFAHGERRVRYATQRRNEAARRLAEAENRLLDAQEASLRAQEWGGVV